jgi:zinc transport system substrate-binding protein
MFIMKLVMGAQAITLFIIFYLAYNYVNAQDISNSTLTNPNDNASAAKSKTDKQSGTNSSGKLVVISSFFPLDQFVRKIGGDFVQSSVLIPVGVEPHDFEPTIKQIQSLNSADVLVYNDLGLENWIHKTNVINKINASKGLNATYSDKRKITPDPHVWLDPLLAKKQVENIRDGLMMIDPVHKDIYFENAKSFMNELDKLDKTIRSELESCKKRDFISFHNSFSYFALRYGVTQHSISGSAPEAEITPLRLTEIIDLAKKLGISVIYSEELVDPRKALVISQEIPNGKVLTLSPIEGITKNEQNMGIGYLDKMNENIRNLAAGLECIQ